MCEDFTFGSVITLTALVEGMGVCRENKVSQSNKLVSSDSSKGSNKNFYLLYLHNDRSPGSEALKYITDNYIYRHLDFINLPQR